MPIFKVSLIFGADMVNLKSIIIGKNASVKETMEVIDKGAKRIALVVENGKLIATVSDGDIRRALLDGYGIDNPIKQIMNNSPIVAFENETKEQILQKATSHKIYQIPIVDDNGELIDLKFVDELLSTKSYPNRVVLMAGGLGTRLRPLTNKVPKPLLKVGGKPIIQTIIENFSKQGFRDFILSVNYKAQMFEEYFGDGSKFGVKIEYVHEDKRMGTAGALSLMRDMLDRDFFVMNGDLLTNLDFTKLLEIHRQKEAKSTMCVREYSYQIPFGVIESEREKIVSIKEKPIYHYHVNSGIYILNPLVLKEIPDDTFYDMPTLFEKLSYREEAYSYKIEDYWLDIGRVEEYQKAQDDYYEFFDKEEELEYV